MKAKKNLVFAGIIAAAAILVMALYVFVISPKLVEPADIYSKAVKLYNDGKYSQSALMLESIKKYSDAQTLSKRAWKRAGDLAYDEGRYEDASACYRRGGSEEDLGKVDDCFIRLAKEEFEKLDPVKGEIYLNAVSSAADQNLIDDARIEGARIILEGTDDPQIATAAVKLLEPCSEDCADEICELLFTSGESFLDRLNFAAAEPALRGSTGFCTEDKLPALNARIERALRTAAEKAKQQGDDELASRLLALADKYAENAKPDEESDDDRIERASALIESGDYIGAYTLLAAMPTDDASVEPLLETVLFYYRRMPCAGANDAYILLGMDGKAEFCGVGWGESTPSWTDLNMVAMGYEDFALGLKNNGTIITAGDGSNGQLSVDGWTGIIQISAGAKHSLGLRSNGTVVAAGWNAYGQTSVNAWTNIIYIAAGKYASYGIRADGTVVACGDNSAGQLNVGSWTDIVAVSAGRAHAVGLRSDGTVVACGDNALGQCNVGSWTDIVMVSASANHTVGLRADGTLVACGDNNNGQDEVSGITNAVAVACGNGYTLVVLADGSVIVLGDVG